jgi:ADP-heptose:LPS heptosyltransferase
LATRLRFLELADLLRHCIFYLGNDTGPMHVAVAVGTRCVGVFSAHNPLGTWHPYGDNHIVLRRNIACQNCYLSTCVGKGLRCLTEIGVEEVWSACQRMLVYR